MVPPTASFNSHPAAAAGPGPATKTPTPADLKAQVAAKRTGTANADPQMAPYKQYLAIKEGKEPREDWDGNVSLATADAIFTSAVPHSDPSLPSVLFSTALPTSTRATLLVP